MSTATEKLEAAGYAVSNVIHRLETGQPALNEARTAFHLILQAQAALSEELMAILKR